MSHRVVRFNRFLIIVNVLVLILLASFFVTEYLKKTIETERLVLKAPDGQPLIELVATEQGGVIAFADANGAIRLQLQGGELPAVLIRGQDQTLVGSFFSMQDGGTAIGLGDQNGSVATFIRGGSDPSLSLYQGSQEPGIAMGMTTQIPHLVVNPPSHDGKMVMHGGEPASLVFVDESGEVPVTLSKYGLNQHSQNTAVFHNQLVEKHLSDYLKTTNH
ncbi:MAG: hypothetical protein SP1CHLAM54_08610 [Chlamydiia bacterium]|nr:hypothetical protein [Chlamydiia bacterium]MCH9615767.1 hypothetical protein [Chlamydiia bacterium]MCH9628830.1 hypothetical protein [Chlamydiia bacterium]